MRRTDSGIHLTDTEQRIVDIAYDWQNTDVSELQRRLGLTTAKGPTYRYSTSIGTLYHRMQNVSAPAVQRAASSLVDGGVFDRVERGVYRLKDQFSFLAKNAPSSSDRAFPPVNKSAHQLKDFVSVDTTAFPILAELDPVQLGVLVGFRDLARHHFDVLDGYVAYEHIRNDMESRWGVKPYVTNKAIRGLVDKGIFARDRGFRARGFVCIADEYKSIYKVQAIKYDPNGTAGDVNKKSGEPQHRR